MKKDEIFANYDNAMYSTLSLISILLHEYLYQIDYHDIYNMYAHTHRTTQALTPVISAQICSTSNCPSQTNFTGEDYATLFFTTTRVNYL